jgi:hypothetical protein
VALDDAGGRDPSASAACTYSWPLEATGSAATMRAMSSPFDRADAMNISTKLRPKNTTSMITKKMKGGRRDVDEAAS